VTFDPKHPVFSIRDAARRRGIYLLPNLFTTAALFAGFYAVVAAMDGNFEQAAIAIFVAMILDGMDGRIARLTNTESDFGMEYDSLSDMVSFGLAPALVVYQWGGARLQEYGWIWGKIGWLVAFLYAVAAALRLARFNARISVADKRFFEGLPSPSAAGVVSGLVWLGTELELTGLPALVLGFVVTAAAGTLMVSSFKYYSFKEWNIGGRIPFAYLLLVPLVFILIAANPSGVLFLMFAAYATTGPVLALVRYRRRTRRQTGHDDSDAGTSSGTGTEG